MTSAGGVAVARSDDHRAGGGSSPTSALHDMLVRPIPRVVAKELIVREHYLRSLPGGTQLTLGVFASGRLFGVVALGVGPFNGASLVAGTSPKQSLTLTRLWLSDDLPRNSESRVLGIVIKALRRNTRIRFLLAYADPSQGHVGTIYQASNWLYIGLSEAMPLYDLGDGVLRHSRSLAHSFGSHSVEHFKKNGVPIRTVAQSRKHRYVYFVDVASRSRLQVPVLPYPKKEMTDEGY